MANKKAKTRTCIACRAGGEKESFLRITKNKAGEISVDRTFKASGRSAYICMNEKCVLKAEKARQIERALRGRIAPEIYEQLKTIVKEEI